MTAPTSLPCSGWGRKDTERGCHMKDKGPICESHVKFVHWSIYVRVYTWCVCDESIKQAVCVASFLLLCLSAPGLLRAPPPGSASVVCFRVCWPCSGTPVFLAGMMHDRASMPDRRQALLPAVCGLPLPLPTSENSHAHCQQCLVWQPHPALDSGTWRLPWGYGDRYCGWKGQGAGAQSRLHLQHPAAF